MIGQCLFPVSWLTWINIRRLSRNLQRNSVEQCWTVSEGELHWKHGPRVCMLAQVVATIRHLFTKVPYSVTFVIITPDTLFSLFLAEYDTGFVRMEQNAASVVHLSSLTWLSSAFLLCAPRVTHNCFPRCNYWCLIEKSAKRGFYAELPYKSKQTVH